MPDDASVKKSKAETLAQKSFVLGLGSIFCGITAIPAIIQAIRAFLQMRKEGAGKEIWIKALVGLLFSSCMLAFFVCMIVAPIRAARQMADASNCCNRIKELAVTMQIYEGDNNDTLPPINKWCDALIENTASQTPSRTLSFLCPAASKRQACGYAINRNLKDVKDATGMPGDTVVLFESDMGWNGNGIHTNAVARHYGSRLWVAFADGSVKDVKLGELEKLRWTPPTNVALAGIK